MTLCKLLLITLLCGLAVAITEVDVDAILAQHKQSLQTLLNMPNQRHGSEGQGECFNWYFDALDWNMNNYREETAECVTNLQLSREYYNRGGEKTRQDFEDRTHTICNKFYVCDSYDYFDLLRFYSCYSVVSTESTSIIFKLSADSTSEYNSLLFKYNNDEFNKELCDKRAGEDYIQRSEKADKQFENCRATNEFPTAIVPT